MGALYILDYYTSRFQIEFMCRDVKQHTGLNDCQARSVNKLDFHFNAALTTINNNWLLLQLFFDKFGISPYSTKNQRKAKELIYHGNIAA